MSQTTKTVNVLSHEKGRVIAKANSGRYTGFYQNIDTHEIFYSNGYGIRETVIGKIVVATTIEFSDFVPCEPFRI